MKILICHVPYRNRGGEDVVAEHEARLLRQAGHDVAALMLPSQDFERLDRVARTGIGLRLGDHEHGRAAIRRAIAESRPDIVHFHNIFPMFGVGALREAAAHGCAVVITLHNYRYSCLAGTHYRAAQVCTACSATWRAPGVARGCYRGSRLESLAMALGQQALWRAINEQEVVHAVITLTDFADNRLRAMGFHGHCVTKANSVATSRCGTVPDDRADVVCVARITEEKGVLPLILSWESRHVRLRVVGDGPQLADCVAGGRTRNVDVLGSLGAHETQAAIRSARALIVPSLWWEGLPTVILEALSHGTPPVVFDHGGMRADDLASLGLSVPVGDFDGLVQRAENLAKCPADEFAAISSACRRAHARLFSDEVNVANLEAIYSHAIARRTAGAVHEGGPGR